jgi:polygalacturonase
MRYGNGKLACFAALIVAWLMPARPVAAAAGRTVDVTSTGAVGDGTTVNTLAIQKAIGAVAAAGGGTVRVPAGQFVTGTVQLTTGVTLRLDAGATLLGSTSVADYRNVDPFLTGDGDPVGHALVVAVDADHVGVEGAGTVDGRGKALRDRQKPFTVRPFLVRFVRCTHVAVRDVHLTNPGAWTLNLFQVSGADIEHVTFRTRDQGLRNNDGVNIDSSEHVRVRDCDVISGDDAVVIKTTSDRPSRDISVTNCKLSTRTNAIKLGTESFGDFEDITVSHCQVTRTGMAGIAMYVVDGGSVRNVTVSDVSIDGVPVPISIRLGERLKTFRPGDKPRAGPGTFSNVAIRNVTAKNVGMIGLLINGVPGHPVGGLTIEQVRIELPGGGTAAAADVRLGEKASAYPEFNMFGKTMPAYGMYVRHVRGMVMRDVAMTLLNPDARPESVMIDVEGAATRP